MDGGAWCVVVGGMVLKGGYCSVDPPVCVLASPSCECRRGLSFARWPWWVAGRGVCCDAPRSDWVRHLHCPAFSCVAPPFNVFAVTALLI